MNQDLIRGWLGLPTGGWPPDHYTLLGLPPGEGDTALIEQRVQERMERVRHYQLSHPDLATEAMNRLAQALICLTDPAARSAYDAGLLNGSRKPGQQAPAAPPPRRVPQQAVVATTLDLDTATVPRAVQVSPPPAETPPEAPPAPGGTGKSSTTTPILRSAPADPVFETARTSREARRGLGTRRGLYHRLSVTRRLMRAWERTGKYLGQPRRRLTRLGEEDDLATRLAALLEPLKEFPPILGQPGQPGQHVASLARSPQGAATFKTLDGFQRDAIARDWRAGGTLLAQHRQFLREELILYRHRTRRARILRAVRGTLSDHPYYTFFGLLAAALFAAILYVLFAF